MTTHACGNATRHTERIGCCGACHRLFSSDSAFDKHRKGGRCLSPVILERHGELVFQPRPSRTAPGEVIWALASTDGRFSA